MQGVELAPDSRVTWAGRPKEGDGGDDDGFGDDEVSTHQRKSSLLTTYWSEHTHTHTLTHSHTHTLTFSLTHSHTLTRVGVQEEAEVEVLESDEKVDQPPTKTINHKH